MTEGDWPAPEPQQDRSRLPLPRVEDLPVAEQGYDRDAVREAFDSFYRHAAQLDATLRTLEAVEVFQRTASELRAEMRTIRAGGWTVSSYGRGYGTRGGGVREWSLPPAFPRVAAEAVFLIVIGVVVGVAGWSRIAIVVVMALALAIVWLVEFVASRERALPQAAVAPPQAPKLDEEPAELPAAEVADELRTEEPEEGPDAITMLEVVEESAVDEDEEPEPAAAEVEDEEPEEPGEPEREAEPPPEVQVTPSPIVLPGGAPPIPAPVPDVEDEPEPAAEAGVAEALDAGDEVDEAPEAEVELADEVVAEPEAVETPPAEAEEESAPAAVEAVADELEAPVRPDEDTLSGIEVIEAEPERRRFRLFRRSKPDDGPVLSVFTPPEDGVGDEASVAEGEIDPWERGPELELLEPVKDEEPEPPQERRWFGRRRPEQEAEPEHDAEMESDRPAVEQAREPEPEPELETEPEREPEPQDLPVEALAEQAAAAIDRSRARRRTPRRSRRR